MTVYKNYLRNDPFSSFSQLNIDQSFYKKIVTPLLNSFSKSLEGHGTEHRCEEFSIILFLNALLGYSPNQGSQILEHKLYSILQYDLSHFIKDTRILPHPSQMTKYASKFSMEEVNTIFLERNKEIISYLLEKGLLPKKINIAFDYKKKLYYGKKEVSHVIGIKAEKGTTKANFWHTCAIILKGREFQIGSEMVESRKNKEQFIQKMVKFFRSLGFIIKLAVLDKEYYTKAIIKYFQSEQITYIIPVKESDKLRSLKEEVLQDPHKRVQNYAMKDVYVKGRGYSHVDFKIGLYAKKKLRFDRLRAKYNRSEINLSKILADIFVLATNQKITAPKLQKKYRFYKVRGDYGTRWRIETSYREVIPFFTFTSSILAEVRNLYFIIALLLYNLWVLANLFLHKKRIRQPKEPMKYFCVFFHEYLFELLQTYVGLDPPHREFCREQQINKMRYIIS